MRDGWRRIFGVACKLPRIVTTVSEDGSGSGTCVYGVRPRWTWGATDDLNCSRGTDSPPPRSRDQAPGPNFGSGVFFEVRRVERFVKRTASEALDRYRGHGKVGRNRAPKRLFGRIAVAATVRHSDETGGTT